MDWFQEPRLEMKNGDGDRPSRLAQCVECRFNERVCDIPQNLTTGQLIPNRVLKCRFGDPHRKRATAHEFEFPIRTKRSERHTERFPTFPERVASIPDHIAVRFEPETRPQPRANMQ